MPPSGQSGKEVRQVGNELRFRPDVIAAGRPGPSKKPHIPVRPEAQNGQLRAQPGLKGSNGLGPGLSLAGQVDDGQDGGPVVRNVDRVADFQAQSVSQVDESHPEVKVVDEQNKPKHSVFQN